MKGQLTPIATKPTFEPPGGWRWALLSEVARLESGHTPSRRVSEYWEGGDVPWLSLKDVRSVDGKTVRDTEMCPTLKGIENSSARLLPAGTVAFCRTASVGKAVILGREMATSQDFVNWICGPDLDSEYLYYALRNSGAFFDKEKQGTTHKTIYLPTVKRFKVLLPPLDEQNRIAQILDAADALRAKRRDSLAQLDTLLQSTFLDMFGDPVTNPMGWEVKSLEELGTLGRGVSKHRPRNDPSLLGGSHPLIQTGEVANSGGYIRGHTSTYSDLGLKQSKMWPAGTLCITIAANIADTGILTFDACFPDSVVGFLSGEEGRVAYVQGLFWFFREILERRAPQSAQKNINLKILRGLPVPAPSNDLQRQFATIVESIEQQKTRHRAHLAELDTLFASLESRAFRGDL